jgi:hypothetical protein
MDIGSQSDQQPKEEFNSNTDLNPNLNPDYSNNKAKNNTLTRVIIIIIIVIFIIVIIYLLLSLEKSKNSNTISNNINSNSKSITKNNPYSGWITYTNSTFGYSFKYPPAWKIYTSNYPNNPNGSKSANSQLGAEVELVNTDGANITFLYNLTGLVGSNQLISKIENFNIDSNQYDLVFTAANSQTSCPQLYTSQPNTYPSSLLPASCTQYTNTVYLVNNSPGGYSTYIQNKNGNYFLVSDIFTTYIADQSLGVLPGSAVGSFYLTLPSQININSINSNADIQTFENILKSLKLPK